MNAGLIVAAVSSEIVIEDRQTALRLLTAVDDPAPWWVYPAQFDREAMSASFSGLVARLENEFGCQCPTSPVPTQDTALYDYVEIPNEATKARDAIYVLISTYFPLATYFVGPVTVNRAGDVRDEVAVVVRRQIERSLTDSGYSCLPMALLSEPYAGDRREYRTANFTWFTRFFDYH